MGTDKIIDELIKNHEQIRKHNSGEDVKAYLYGCNKDEGSSRGSGYRSYDEVEMMNFPRMNLKIGPLETDK